MGDMSFARRKNEPTYVGLVVWNGRLTAGAGGTKTRSSETAEKVYRYMRPRYHKAIQLRRLDRVLNCEFT